MCTPPSRVGERGGPTTRFRAGLKGAFPRTGEALHAPLGRKELGWVAEPRGFGIRSRIPYETDPDGGPGKHNHHFRIRSARATVHEGATALTCHLQKSLTHPLIHLSTSGHREEHRRTRRVHTFEMAHPLRRIGTRQRHWDSLFAGTGVSTATPRWSSSHNGYMTHPQILP